MNKYLKINWPGYRGVSWDRGDVCFEVRHGGMWLFCVVSGSQELTIWTSNGETSKSVPDVLFLFEVGVWTFLITAESLLDYQFWVIFKWYFTVRLCERIAFGVIPKPSRRVAGAVFLMLDHSGHSVSCRPARTCWALASCRKGIPTVFKLDQIWNWKHTVTSHIQGRAPLLWEKVGNCVKRSGTPGESICSSANSGLTRQWGCPYPGQGAGTQSHLQRFWVQAQPDAAPVSLMEEQPDLPSLWRLTMSERTSSSELTDPCGCRVDSRKEGPWTC